MWTRRGSKLYTPFHTVDQSEERVDDCRFFHTFPPPRSGTGVIKVLCPTYPRLIHSCERSAFSPLQRFKTGGRVRGRRRVGTGPIPRLRNRRSCRLGAGLPIFGSASAFASEPLTLLIQPARCRARVYRCRRCPLDYRGRHAHPAGGGASAE